MAQGVGEGGFFVAEETLIPGTAGNQERLFSSVTGQVLQQGPVGSCGMRSQIGGESRIGLGVL